MISFEMIDASIKVVLFALSCVCFGFWLGARSSQRVIDDMAKAADEATVISQKAIALSRSYGEILNRLHPDVKLPSDEVKP